MRIKYVLMVVIMSMCGVLQVASASELPLVLLLTSGEASARFIESDFQSELGLSMDNYRVESRRVEDKAFFTASPEAQIKSAGALQRSTGAAVIIWLSGSADRVTGLGLYVVTADLHLARQVVFDAPMDFLPDVALIATGLIEHAIDYGQSIGGGSGQGGADGDTGIGRRIPIPDGWILVAGGPQRAEAQITEGNARVPDAEAPSDPPDETPMEEAPTAIDKSPATDETRPVEAAAETDMPPKNETADEPSDGRPPDAATPPTRDSKPPRRFGIAAAFSLDQGIASRTGPSTWLGGSGEVLFFPFPELMLLVGVTADGGAFPKGDATVSGSRIRIEIGAAYRFRLGIVGLGPELRVTPERTVLTIEEDDYVPIKKNHWVFRAALGPSLRVPAGHRLSFQLSLLLNLAAKGERFVRADEARDEVYKTALLDLTVRAGMLLAF